MPSEHKVIIKNDIDRARVNPRHDSIIISRMNTPELVGASAYVEEDYNDLFLPDRLWQTVRKRNDFLMKYVFYTISSPKIRDQIRSICGGTSGSMKNISKNSFLNIEIPLPSIEAQSRIVEKVEEELNAINSIKNLIEINNRKIRHTIEKIYE